MAETNNIYPDLSPILLNSQQFRLNRISDSDIASFDYFDKSLIVLSVTIGSFSIASFATVIGAPVGILSASFSLAFSISTGIIKSY